MSRRDFHRVLGAQGVFSFGAMLSRLATPWLATLSLQATPLLAALRLASVRSVAAEAVR